MTQKKMKALWVWLCKNGIGNSIEWEGKLIKSITLTEAK